MIKNCLLLAIAFSRVLMKEEKAEEIYANFLNLVGVVPIEVLKCDHAEKGADDLIEATDFHLDAPAGRGKTNNITIKG